MKVGGPYQVLFASLKFIDKIKMKVIGINTLRAGI